MNFNTGGAEKSFNSNTFMSVTMYTRNKNDVMGSKAVLMLLCYCVYCVYVCALCVPSLSLCVKRCYVCMLLAIVRRTVNSQQISCLFDWQQCAQPLKCFEITSAIQSYQRIFGVFKCLLSLILGYFPFPSGIFSYNFFNVTLQYFWIWIIQLG